MALPPEYETEETTRLSSVLLSMTPHELVALPPLTEDDCKVIGVLTQYYCFIDLDLRRALEIFYLAKMLPQTELKNYPDYKDSHLADVLRQTLERIKPVVEDLDTMLTWIKVIDVCRAYRNLVAHFAGKRFPNEEALVFASKSDRDARRARGTRLPKYGWHVSVVTLPEFENMCVSVADAHGWLTNMIPIWHRGYPEQK